MNIAVGDRVAIASEVAKEGVCDREQRDRADKIVRCPPRRVNFMMLGFVIDSLD